MVWSEAEPEVIPDGEDHPEGEEAPSAESVTAARDEVARDFPDVEPRARDLGLAPADNRFAHLDPNKVVPPKLLAEALAFFRAHEASFTNRKHISILDYGLKSTERRFHVVNMATGEVWSLRMSNGKGSEPVHNGIATSFGNVPGSNKSSLGFARTAETYNGKHGRSLRLDGLSASNSKLRPRAVVVHGADYVKDAPVVQGRSNGCPAVPMGQKDSLIDLIKGGSLMYAANSRE